MPKNFFTFGLKLTVESRVRQRESRAGTTHISGSIWLHRSTSGPQQVAVRNILISPSQLVSGQLVTRLARSPNRFPLPVAPPRMLATPLLTAFPRTP
jgi:sirohydrochlorin ferrochelatase